MAGENTFTTMNALFKEVYGELQNAVPDHVKFMKAVPFSGKDKQIGLNYNEAIVLGMEHGVSYGGPDGDAFTYAAASAATHKTAQIRSCEMVLRGVIARSAISRSALADKNAFAKATKHVIENLFTSAFHKYEAQCFYGGVGLATVSSVNSNEIAITEAEWADGLWAGAEGMRVEVYNAALDTNRGDTTIASVDLINRKLTLTAAPVGTVATDVIFEKGAKGKEFIGVHKMINETSGNIFGISTASYSLWRGNKFNVGGAISFAKVSESVAQGVAKGALGKLTLYINPKKWSVLLSEQTAQRQFHEGGISEYSNGAESIKFFSQNGTIEIMAHPMVKEGYAYLLNLDTFSRVGSKDITFESPEGNGQFLKALDDSNAVQAIIYTDSALFCSKLGHNTILYGIT